MPTLGVTVAVIEDGRVLVTKRADLPVWCLPGGGVDASESLAQAAVREVREETGLEVALTRLVGVYSRPRWYRGGAHEVLFAAQRIGGEARPQGGKSAIWGSTRPTDSPNRSSGGITKGCGTRWTTPARRRPGHKTRSGPSRRTCPMRSCLPCAIASRAWCDEWRRNLAASRDQTICAWKWARHEAVAYRQWRAREQKQVKGKPCRRWA